MKIYKSTNVYEEAKERLKYLFQEFENIYVNISGGKDSTVVFNLCLEVARDLNRLPLNVLFLDQEAEWDATIDHVREIMNHEDVNPFWFQIPFRMTNSTSQYETYVNTWGEGEEWIRPKESIAIHKAPWKADRFHAFFDEFMAHYHKGEKACHIAGVRGEESPTRLLGLTNSATYKWITWGKKFDPKREHYNFYPIYDWSYRDVWKYINDNEFSYNRIYDYQYQHGIPVNKMRVSNLHHETAIHQLFYMAECEPENYNKLVKRIKGINSAVKSNDTGFFLYELPFMFTDWKEYRDYLLDKLIMDDKEKERFAKAFKAQDKIYEKYLADKMHKVHVQSILANDISHTKLKNFDRSPACYQIRKKLKNEGNTEINQEAV
jgi:predicted phosphoadenosine phosphosulfate sulfurtransferase